MNIQKVEAFCLLSQLSGYKWLYIHNIYTLYIHNVSIICHNSRGCTPIGELTMDWDGTMSRPIAHRRPNSCSFKNACFKVTHSQKSEHFRDWFTDSMCFFLIRCVDPNSPFVYCFGSSFLDAKYIPRYPRCIPIFFAKNQQPINHARLSATIVPCVLISMFVCFFVLRSQ